MARENQHVRMPWEEALENHDTHRKNKRQMRTRFLLWTGEPAVQFKSFGKGFGVWLRWGKGSSEALKAFCYLKWLTVKPGEERACITTPIWVDPRPPGPEVVCAKCSSPDLLRCQPLLSHHSSPPPPHSPPHSLPFPRRGGKGGESVEAARGNCFNWPHRWASPDSDLC